MTKLDTIKQGVESLSESDQSKFRRWYAELNARLFDERIERDAKSGKLDALAREALAEHRAGKSTEL